VKVEPKTFFANERTLLQWISMAVVLLFAALALLSIDGGVETRAQGYEAFRATPERNRASGSSAGETPVRKSRTRAHFVAGALLAPVSVAFMAYALGTYLWRARRIQRREPGARYDDIVGPTVLVLVLVVVSAVAAFVAVDAGLERW
jgi:uncharacterized membrane protein YidH (DUF202 family)